MFQYIGEKQGERSQAVTTAQLRSQLSLIDADDTFLSSLIMAAQGAVEGETRRLLTSREISLCYRGRGIVLSLDVSPVIELTSVTVDGVALEGCEVSAYGLKPTLTFPQEVYGEVIVTLEAGHSDDDPAPPELIQVVKMLAADMYEHREATAEKSLSENRNYRRIIDMHAIIEVN